MIERLLVVGYGSIGKRHLRIARQILPCADIRLLRHRSCDQQHEDADGCFVAIEDACAFKPQVAIISNPAPYHINVAIALAKVGCHLLVEKPLADSTEGIDQLLELAECVGIKLQVGYNLRYIPSLQKFRNLVQDGIIGEIYSVRAEIGQYLPSWRPGSDYRTGVSAKKALGGGVLLELSHEIDYLRWVFGDFAWVQAWLGKQSSLDVDVEDSVHLMLGFKQKQSGYHAVASLNMDFFRHDVTRSCIAIGEAGSLRWNAVLDTVDYWKPEVGEWQAVYTHTCNRDESYTAQLQSFLSCIKSDNRPVVTGMDGICVLNLIDAARESASKNGLQIEVS